jgi:dTDP-4-amino-4,6-dideoxygalactose transaminase
MIHFVDLKTQYHAIKEEIDRAIGRVLESSQFILGEEVDAFEREFAAFCGAKYGIGVSSGTSALHLALVAAGIGPGDEVITVPFTFVATVAAIEYVGARPVLVDIDPRTYTIDAARLEDAVTSRTKAIVPVHLYGHPADMDPVLQIATARRLRVIEDAAQAHGARYNGRAVGSFGDLACFSFYPSKNLGAYGDGGLITTSDEALASELRLLRTWGERKKYEHLIPAFNARLDGLQAAILRVKLRYLDRWTELRRRHAARYTELLADSGVVVPVEAPHARHVYHLYTVCSPSRNALHARLLEAGISTGMHYPVPVHLQPAYAHLGYGRGAFPESERAAAEVLSLPMFPELTDEQIERVAAVVKASSRVPA